MLKAADSERASRLGLCDLTGRVLQQGLGVLGIETLGEANRPKPALAFGAT